MSDATRACPVHPDVEMELKQWGKTPRPHCPKCHNERVKVRREKLKTEIIQLSGNQCVRCGWNKYPQTLEFHSDAGDLTEREWRLSKDRLMAEVSNCELLCPNCHAVAHIEGT